MSGTRNRIRALPAVAALAMATAFAAAGCGGGSDGGNAYGSSGESAPTRTAGGETVGGRYGGPTSSPTSGAVSTATVGDVGEVLVDSKGLTLYYFEKDSGGRSSCYGACASAWPPLTTSGAPHATGGAEASKLGTTKRTDGTVQVTYAGWPLYTYAADTKPGEDNGADVDSFGAPWYPLHPSGKKAGK